MAVERIFSRYDVLCSGRDAAAATDCIIIFCCNQSRHRSVSGGFIAHQVLAGMHSDTTVVHLGASSGSWNAMYGSCRGRCEVCSHSTDQSQLDVVALVEEAETYCKWSGRGQKPDNVFAYKYGGVIAKARPVPKAVPSVPAPVSKPKPSSRAQSSGMDRTRRGSPSVAVPKTQPSTPPPPQMDPSALADHLSLLTREVEHLRTEMDTEPEAREIVIQQVERPRAQGMTLQGFVGAVPQRHMVFLGYAYAGHTEISTTRAGECEFILTAQFPYDAGADSQPTRVKGHD
eukprot:s2459_g4.t1